MVGKNRPIVIVAMDQMKVLFEMNLLGDVKI